MDSDRLYQNAVALLKSLIATPSFSKEEDGTARLLHRFLEEQGVLVQQQANNVFAKCLHFDAAKPTLLLNSHHDTVRPNSGYTNDPFTPLENEGKLFGLGSNDAGGCVVALTAAFLHFYEKENLPYNLILALTAEEEISGTGGIEALWSHLPPIDCAIVGEPTLLQMAVAERGLMVLDGVATGKAGHAARNEGENALYKALDDINQLRHHVFTKTSPLLGPVQTTVTVMETENKAHNQVPAHCRFVVDVRLNECYTHKEVLEQLQQLVKSSLAPRSTRLRSSLIKEDHPLVQAGLQLGLHITGSPTTSDKALIPVPALKIGPGDSARSHSADEFIYLHEIEQGIHTYVQLINALA